MEIAASFLDEEWESLSQIFSSGENLDFFATTSFDEGLFFNMHGNEDQHHHHTFESMTMNLHGNAGFMELPSHDFVRLEGENRANLETADSCGTKRMFEAADEVDDKSEGFPMENPLKKPRVSRNKNTSVQPKRGEKIIQEKNNEEEINGGGISSSCTSEDDSNASQEVINEEIKNSNTKARASRSSATDPQSLYAKGKRERINERLKILQNLVPNGTKVDISTMLEEAVQYVKFLQLQIKLLSSDNMWMYAPLAYNGTDIGIYDQICPNLRL
ncbi:transcription factor bHLH139-like [Salvia splendens]|uniref:transcription factor bHLH139-like n=1 Tax=Salvia splendens TaxID=180675 RepID=UPI001C27DE2F|nr:transcription factor bHLH139-like [Salvia splendens]